jgi:CRISPR-associated protein Cas5h
MNKVIIFDIWGDYAHFKKIYTTSSPLTYGIPSRTALCGLIGSILGFSKNKYNEILGEANIKFSVKIINKIIKTRMGFNWIDTKSAGKNMNSIKQRTQIKIEFVKNPKYRIYVSLSDDKLYEKLLHNIKNHETYYTPCLGVAYCIANFEFISENNFQKIESFSDETFLDIVGTITLDNLKDKNSINFISDNSEFHYIKEKIPFYMNNDREVLEYKNYLFEKSGKTLSIKPKFYYQLDNKEKIILL